MIPDDDAASTQRLGRAAGVYGSLPTHEDIRHDDADFMGGITSLVFRVNELRSYARVFGNDHFLTNIVRHCIRRMIKLYWTRNNAGYRVLGWMARFLDDPPNRYGVAQARQDDDARRFLNDPPNRNVVLQARQDGVRRFPNGEPKRILVIQLRQVKVRRIINNPPKIKEVLQLRQGKVRRSERKRRAPDRLTY